MHGFLLLLHLSPPTPPSLCNCPQPPHLHKTQPITFSPPKHPSLHVSSLAKAHAHNMLEEMTQGENHSHVEGPMDSTKAREIGDGSSSLRHLGKRVRKYSQEYDKIKSYRRNEEVGEVLDSIEPREMSDGSSSWKRHLDKRAGKNSKKYDKSKSYRRDEIVGKIMDSMEARELGNGCSSLRPLDKKLRKNSHRYDKTTIYRRNEEVGSTRNEKVNTNVREKHPQVGKLMDSLKPRKMGDGSSSLRPLDKRVSKNSKNYDKITSHRRNGEVGSSRSDKVKTNLIVEGKFEKKGKKSKNNSPQFELRVGLDMCSKNGDVMGAISLFDSALEKNIRLEQYHYNVLLYLCSSAASGVVHPGKSGSTTNFDNEEQESKNLGDAKDSDSRIEDKILNSESGDVGCASEEDFESETSKNDSLKKEIGSTRGTCEGIRVSESIKKYALKRGFEIYEKIRSEQVPLNEAALTSVARMAMAMGNGDMAFDIVKEIKALGLTLRLRSYGPALFSFCNNGNIEKAFEVEQHMLESGVGPEEPELAALLKVSIEACRSEKVYYLLQKLRTSVRQVSPSTATLIEMWFKSSTASRVGKRKWNDNLVEKAIENGGGGWHGLGWLGKGKWSVVHTSVDTHGFCQGCGEKLVAIDIDPVETENFARSIAVIAAKRERHSNFQKFQKWLDYYGPFEAVVDAANIGLFSQRLFSVTKVNAVVNSIRQKLPSKKWPLIVVHNRRVYGGKMDEPQNKRLIEKWKNADALYATPTGSNDDWYWLYAAVKCKALIVTNDEMRDHLFQILGNDFFPKWKERHQVHFNFEAGGPQFYMPPACSIVIQESRNGHWHVPILSEGELEVGRNGTWLCITRPLSQESSKPCKETSQSERRVRSQSQSTTITSRKQISTDRVVGRKSVAVDLDAAEDISGKVINFEI